MHSNRIAPRDLISIGIWIELYWNEGRSFPIYLVKEGNNSLEHLNRKCSTAAPHDSKPFYYMFCRIQPLRCLTMYSSSSCFSCSSLTGTSSQRARKEVTNITWVWLQNKTSVRNISSWISSGQFSSGVMTVKQWRNLHIWLNLTEVFFHNIRDVYVQRWKVQLASYVKFTLQYFIMLLTCPVFIHSGKKGRRPR